VRNLSRLFTITMVTTRKERLAMAFHFDSQDEREVFQHLYDRENGDRKDATASPILSEVSGR
jgi:hypothetical protein